ncbi:MAG: FmdB family zinc ribbon protein [Desulfobacterales bacterium]
MPIYEFKCADCGNVQEVLVRSGNASEEVEMKCKACGGEVLERVLSRVGYSMGSAKGTSPAVSSHSCGSGNSCATIDIPGPSG